MLSFNALARTAGLDVGVDRRRQARPRRASAKRRASAGQRQRFIATTVAAQRGDMKLHQHPAAEIAGVGYAQAVAAAPPAVEEPVLHDERAAADANHLGRARSRGERPKHRVYRKRGANRSSEVSMQESGSVGTLTDVDERSGRCRCGGGEEFER